jgi:hypothetical protein
MSRRSSRNHSLAFKAKVALAATPGNCSGEPNHLSMHRQKPMIELAFSVEGRSVQAERLIWFCK